MIYLTPWRPPYTPCPPAFSDLTANLLVVIVHMGSRLEQVGGGEGYTGAGGGGGYSGPGSVMCMLPYRSRRGRAGA